MPAADAGAGLPGEVLTAVGDAALHVPEHGLLVGVVEDLAGDDHLRLTAVLLCAVVVEVFKDVEAILVVCVGRGTVEREHGVVEINHVGVVLVDALQDAVLELLHVRHRGRADAVAPAPLAVDCAPVAPVGAVGVVLGVELLRVEAVPPIFVGFIGIFFEAVLFSHVNVVGIAHLEEGPGVSAVHRNTHAQTVTAAGLCPVAHDVAQGADLRRVPLLIGAVPAVEVVVVLAHSHEVLGSGVGVELYQGFGVELVGFPVVA